MTASCAATPLALQEQTRSTMAVALFLGQTIYACSGLLKGTEEVPQHRSFLRSLFVTDLPL